MAEKRAAKDGASGGGGAEGWNAASGSEGSRLLSGGGTGGGSGFTINAAPPAPFEDENPVENVIYFSLQATGVFLLLSVLGVLVCILRVLDFTYGQWRLQDMSYWLVLSPFWAADLYALLSGLYVLGCCIRFRPTSQEEKRNLVRVAPREASRSIRMEMLPLVRRVVWGTIGSVPALLLLTASQALACCYLEYGRPSLVFAAAPLVVLEGLGILETICLRTGSLIRAVGWLLALLSTTALVLRLSGQWPLTPSVPMWVAFVPLWALTALFLLQLAYISFKTGCMHRYRLTKQVVQCMALYLSSLLSLTVASVLYCWRGLGAEIEEALHDRVHGVRLIVTAVFTFFGLGLAALSAFLVMEEEVDYAITTSGYADPLPLSRTSRGWEPTGAKMDYWLLLGRVEVLARTARPKGGEPESPVITGASRPIQRTDSGSYANLYEDL